MIQMQYTIKYQYLSSGFFAGSCGEFLASFDFEVCKSLKNGGWACKPDSEILYGSSISCGVSIG
jgi:hypothetical protein